MQAMTSPHWYKRKDTAYIPVFRKDLVVDYAIIDREDLNRVREFKWLMNKDGYAYRRERRCENPDGKLGQVYLQRFVKKVGRDNPLVVDHRNGNTLDNRKSNLEMVEQKKNGFAFIQRERRSLNGVQKIC